MASFDYLSHQFTVKGNAMQLANAPENRKPFKPTEKRLFILERATRHPIGLVSRPYLTGFERVSWDKNSAYLVEHGLLTRYIYDNEYEITEAGRDLVRKIEN
jgi:hypothetical protein